jgi:hypothetical protein
MVSSRMAATAASGMRSKTGLPSRIRRRIVEAGNRGSQCRHGRPAPARQRGGYRTGNLCDFAQWEGQMSKPAPLLLGRESLQGIASGLARN